MICLQRSRRLEKTGFDEREKEIMNGTEKMTLEELTREIEKRKKEAEETSATIAGLSDKSDKRQEKYNSIFERIAEYTDKLYREEMEDKKARAQKAAEVEAREKVRKEYEKRGIPEAFGDTAAAWRNLHADLMKTGTHTESKQEHAPEDRQSEMLLEVARDLARKAEKKDAGKTLYEMIL